MDNEKILIVVDMQNDFITGALANKDAKAIIPNVVSKINKYIENDDYIFFTKDTHYKDKENHPNYLDTSEGKKLPIEHCILGTKGHDFVEEIDSIIYHLPNNSEYTKPIFDEIHKNRFGSGDDIAIYIDEICMDNGYENRNFDIEVIGLCTDICVINNAMIANALCGQNGSVTVDAACCAGVTKESHDIALQAMKACQIDILNEGKEPWRKNYE